MLLDVSNNTLMDAKGITVNRLDHLDAERFREMLLSPSWLQFRAKLEAELERARLSCERTREAEDIHRAQGSVSALRSVLAIPEQLLKEMTAKK